MREVSLCLMVTTLVTWMGGCAETGVSCPPGERLLDDGECVKELEACVGQVTEPINMFCVVNVDAPGLDIAPFALQPQWDLTVEPTVIPAGRPFAAGFRVKAQFPTSIVNDGLALFASEGLPAFETLEIMAAEARVQVRRGATLTSESEVRLTADLPLSIDFEKNYDCSRGGQCAALGHGPGGAGGACRAGFCVTKPIDIDLSSEEGADLWRFEADESGSVLFGLREPETGPIQIGLNRGAFELEPRSPGDPIVHSGVDVRVSGVVDIAFECVMAVNSRGPDGVGTPTVEPSPSPDAAYIACPIEESE